MKMSEKYLDKKFTTHNGTHVVIVSISTGTIVVEATLHARVEFIIHSTVAIEPQVVALPWEPTVKTRNEVALKASGGDGSYSWTS
uniref:Uncharacterized protein n=1 Tax=Trichogramma kaykai TaxID=54128 RepID=A0ABD2XNX7_9HYME